MTRLNAGWLRFLTLTQRSNRPPRGTDCRGALRPPSSPIRQVWRNNLALLEFGQKLRPGLEELGPPGASPLGNIPSTD